MAAHEFAPIANALREAVLAYYADQLDPLNGGPSLNTLETNSGWVERRSKPLLEILRDRGVPSIAGLDVIDIGCGFGAMSAFLAAAGGNVVGVDPHASRLEVGRSVARSHGLPVEFLQGRMEDLSMLGSRCFDVAVHNNSFCYIVPRDMRMAALRETLRVLRPGGWLVARNPNRWTPVDHFSHLPLVHLLPPAAAQRLARALGTSRSYVRIVSPPAACRELSRAGFVDIRQAGFQGRHPEILKPLARYQHFTARRLEG